MSGTPVFAYKGETLNEYWEYTHRIFEWPLPNGGAGTPNMILDDGGDATLLVHLGAQAETDRSVIAHPANEEEFALFTAIVGPPGARAALLLARSRPTSRASPRRRRPASSASTPCTRKGASAFPAINVNDSVTKSKFDNLYGCRESLVDGIKRATDVMIAGKVALVCGYGDVGKGSAQALRALSAQVWIAEIDPICALQAAMEGYRVVTMDYAARQGRHLRHRHRQHRRDHPRSHEADEEQRHRLQHRPLRQRDRRRVAQGLYLGQHQAAGRPHHLSRRQADHPAGRGAAGESGLRHRASELRDVELVFANQVMAQIELWADARERTGKYPVGVYVLPKHLDEKVARLQLTKLGAMLTPLSDKQARYIGVDAGGPYKPDSYRY